MNDSFEDHTTKVVLPTRRKTRGALQAAVQREALVDSYVIAGLKYREDKCKNNANIYLIGKKKKIKNDLEKAFEWPWQVVVELKVRRNKVRCLKPKNQNINMRCGETGENQREDLKDTMNLKLQMNQQ